MILTELFSPKGAFLYFYMVRLVNILLINWSLEVSLLGGISTHWVCKKVGLCIWNCNIWGSIHQRHFSEGPYWQSPSSDILQHFTFYDILWFTTFYVLGHFMFYNISYFTTFYTFYIWHLTFSCWHSPVDILMVKSWTDKWMKMLLHLIRNTEQRAKHDFR